MDERRKFIGAAAVIAAVLVAEWIWYWQGWGGTRVILVSSDLFAVVTPAAAAVGCILAARRRTGTGRRAWRLLGAGAGTWAVGGVAWAYYEILGGREVPFPSIADVGYLAAIPLLAAGLLSFPYAPETLASRLRTALDGLIVVLSILFISWALVLGPMYRSGEGSRFAQAIGLAYPVGDVVTIALVVFVGARAVRGERATLAIMGAGLIALSLADSGFAYLNLQGVYSSGNLIDPLWNLGWLLVLLAALRPAPPLRARADESPTVFMAMLPYMPLAAALLFALFEIVAEGELGLFLGVVGVAAFALVGARQLLALLENIRLNHGLERIVGERTSELRATVEELADRRRLQDQFVANISHELRTPLTTIVGMTHTLLRPELDVNERARGMVEAAQRAGSRMQELVESLLEASGLTVGTVTRPEPIELAGVLDEVGRVVQTGGRRVVREIPARMLVRADAARLRHVVAHVLSNAVKFSPPDSTITLTTKSHDGVVDLLVIDEGPGIAPAMREKVFERFYQASDTDATRPGVGLGLYLARRLAESMGATLTIDEGPASALRVTMPAAGESA